MRKFQIKCTKFISFQCRTVVLEYQVTLSYGLWAQMADGRVLFQCTLLCGGQTKDSRPSLNKSISMAVLEYCHLCHCELNVRDYNTLLCGKKLQIAGIERIIS